MLRNQLEEAEEEEMNKSALEEEEMKKISFLKAVRII